MPVKARAGGQGRVRTGRPGAQTGSGSTPGSPAGDGGPAFQTDFTAISSLPTGVSLSRATTGTRFNSSGVLVTEAIDAPRFDYAWNGSAWVAKGLLIENQRINLFLQTGSPANQTITVANGTAYSVSFYGTGTLTLSGAATQTMNGSSANVRTSYTFTASTTSLVIAVSGSVTYPNVEAGGFATSHITTTTAAVTRSADIAQLTGAALALLQASAASIIVENDTYANSSTFQYIVGFTAGDGSGLNYNGSAFTEWNGSANLTGNSSTRGATDRIGLAFSGVGRSIVSNGGTVASDAGAIAGAAFPTVYLGSNGGAASFLDGHIRSFAIYSSRLPDATLQAESVVGAAF
jgi:hypothetical protein